MNTAIQHFAPVRVWGALALAAAVAAGLAACGGSGDGPPADPLATFKQQKLDWQPCDPSILGQDVPYFEQLGERAKCALMRAPLDYAHPEQGELAVALLKVSAEQPQQRAGSILFNPGGPGTDGLFLSPMFGALWMDANPDSPSGKTLKDLSNRYDLIGFSPRGLGASSRLYCASNELVQPANHISADRSAENIQAVQHNIQLGALACGKNPLTKAIHTDATARDMDLVRVLAGDERLNFIGYSYGTWLGAWYASLFPERVGRMLLDSSMDVTADYDQAKRLSAMGTQRVFDEVMSPYAARHPDWFSLGTDPADVGRALQALPDGLKSVVLSNFQFDGPDALVANLDSLRGVIGLQTLLQAQPAATPEQLLQAIDGYTFMPDPAHDAVARGLAHELVKAKYSTALAGPQSVVLEPKEAVRNAVMCNDMPTKGDAQYWTDIAKQDLVRYPIDGGEVSRNYCLYWGGPVVKRPPLSAAAQAGPLLMLQSRYDALTPIEAAQATLAALPNASMIVVEDEYKHGLFPYGDTCVDPQIGAYFAHGTLPSRTSSCPGKPLPGEAGPFTAQSAQLRRTQAPSPAAPSTYNQPERAADIMRAIHRQLAQAQHGG